MSYGITSNVSDRKFRPREDFSDKKTTKPNGFVPDEETKKFYEKPSTCPTGFWTSEDFTFRDTLAKDVRNEIEDEIDSDQSDEDSELEDLAERADMNDEQNDEEKKTILERFIDEQKFSKDSKSNESD